MQPSRKGSTRGASAASPPLPLRVDKAAGANECTALLPHKGHHHARHSSYHSDIDLFDDDDDDDDLPGEGSIAQLKDCIGTSMVGSGVAAAGGDEDGDGSLAAAAGGLADQLRPLVHLPYLPCLAFGWQYFDKDVWADVIAGAVVSVVAVPQGLAYSLLASLPPQTGLYTSFVPTMIYGWLGTSRVLSAGPVAIVSVLVPSIAAAMHAREPEMRLAVACMSTIVSGGLLMLIGLFKLGGLVRFISSPVLTGFTTASALVIGVSQFQHIVAVPLPSFTYNGETVHYLWRHLHEANLVAMAIGFATIAFLMGLRKLSKRNPHRPWLRALNTVSALLVLVASTLTSYFLITKGGVQFPIVGYVPAGSPRFSAALPFKAVRDLTGLGDLIVACLPVTLLAFMSSWSLSRKFASKLGHTDLDANQEAVAIGASNLVAGFFMCFPSSGSFGRTTLNALNGARSPFSNISASLAVLLCLWFFTPLLYYVPMACLGGIIEASLASLFEWKPFKRSYRISKPDFAVMCVTAFTTAFVNIEVGLCVGIFVSIAVLLQELSEVRTSVMVPIPSAGGGYLLRSQSVDATLLESKHIKVIRLTASLFFGNQEELRNGFQELVLSGGDDIKAVVVDASGVSHLDFTGVEAIDFMHKFSTERGVKLVFANAKGIFRERLKSSKLWAKLGEEAYEDLSVDEVVTKLLEEEGLCTASMEDMRWGSPKEEKAAGRMAKGSSSPGKNAALRRGGGGGCRRQGCCPTVVEGHDEEEGGSNGAGGRGFGPAGSPPVFGAAPGTGGHVSVNVTSRAMAYGAADGSKM